MYKTHLTKLPVYLIIFTFLLAEASLIINCQPISFEDQPINNTLSKNSQPLPPRTEWNYTHGFYDTDKAFSVDQTSDNGYIFTGYTDKNYFGNRADVWLLKTDNKGNELWNKTFHNKYGDVGHYVQQTNDNGYIIIGGNSVSTGCYDDVLLIKTDSEGNEQWNRTFGGPYMDKGNYGQQTNDGGYIIAGSTQINVTQLDKQIWVIKTDENGNEQWNRTYGGNRTEYGDSIQQTNDNGYIILGITIPQINEVQIVLFKTDENGLVQWNKTYTQLGIFCHGTKVQQTNDNGYIIIGSISTINTPDDYSKALLIKTNENGNISWVKTYQKNLREACMDGQQTNDGGFILAGCTNPPGQDVNDIWVFKTDSNGNMTWDRTFDVHHVDHAWSIQQTNDNGYIIAGDTWINNQLDEDAYIIKLAPETKPKPSLIGGTITNLQNYTNYTIFNAKNILLFQVNPLRINYLFKNEEIIVGNNKIGILNDKIALGIFNSNI